MSANTALIVVLTEGEPSEPGLGGAEYPGSLGNARRPLHLSSGRQLGVHVGSTARADGGALTAVPRGEGNGSKLHQKTGLSR
jgi:hypothetical protein